MQKYIHIFMYVLDIYITYRHILWILSPIYNKAVAEYGSFKTHKASDENRLVAKIVN